MDVADEHWDTERVPPGMSSSKEKASRVYATLMRVKRPERVAPAITAGWPTADLRLGKLPGTLLDPKNPPELPFNCEDTKCDNCFSQFFPATYAVVDEEAAEIVGSLANGVKGDLQYLRGILQTQADVIAARWQKKTYTWRRKLLLDNTAVYPKKPAPVHLLHAQDVPDTTWNEAINKFEHGMTKEQKALSRSLCVPRMYKFKFGYEATRLYQDTWLLPYLDAESLAENPLRLLGLLYHRTVNDPEAWLMFDNTQLVMAEHLAIIPLQYNKHCVVMHGSQYGTLVDWNAEQAHRWEIIGYNKAHYLLMAQRRMMRFLRKVVDALIPQSQLVLQVAPPQLKWNKLVYEKLLTAGSDLAWSTDSVRPFSAPPSFNPHKILEAVTARYRAAKDDLEFLQTDPSYVQFLIAELSSTIFFEKLGGNSTWAFFVDELILVPLRREIYWRQLLGECERMVQAFDALQKNSEECARDKYDLMLYVVADCAVEIFAMMVLLLDYSLPFQRGFERNFHYQHEVKGNGEARGKLICIREDSFPSDMLFWSLSCMGADSYRGFTMDPSTNFSTLDDYLSTASARDRARISQRTYDHVSDMAVVNEVIFSVRSEKLRNRQPSTTRVTPLMEEDFRVEWFKKAQGMDPIKLSKVLAPHLKDVCQNNPWPVGKRDRKWLHQANLSRTSLAKFWTTMRSIYAKQLRSAGNSQHYVDLEVELFSAHKSPAYAAELQQEAEGIREQEMAEITASRSMAYSAESSSFSSLHHMAGKENARLIPMTIREKPKTRPDVVSESKQDQQEHAFPDVEPRLHSSPINVKPENMSVFINMFPTTSNEGRRNFKWQHFLDAMADTGLSISQASGSAVSFAFRSPEVDAMDLGSIVFHRPHPVALIHPVMMRSIGKRMKKWFGWQRETFVERKKEKDHEKTME